MDDVCWLVFVALKGIYLFYKYPFDLPTFILLLGVKQTSLLLLAFILTCFNQEGLGLNGWGS